jgi:hypothetical protein
VDGGPPLHASTAADEAVDRELTSWFVALVAQDYRLVRTVGYADIYVRND